MKKSALDYINKLISSETTKKELDIIEYIKRCIREYKEEKKMENVQWEPMFDVLWKIYPRKIDKQSAKKIFEHKIRGLGEQECKDKCNLIYKAEMRYISQINQNRTPIGYIKHFGTWLNAEVPNSPKYKGR